MAYFASGFLQGMQGVASIMRMQQLEEDAKPERELRRLEIEQRREEMAANKELKSDLKGAAQYGVVQDGVSTGEQGNRLFNKDAAQGAAVNDMVNAQREMQDQPVMPSQKAATVANGIYDSNAGAQEAGLGLNSRADVMQRQGDVYMKHGKADLADTLLSRADALRKEGGAAALQQVMAGADAKTVEDTFNKSGNMKVSEVRIETLPEDPAKPGIPQYKVFGKRGTSAEEVDLLGGKDAMTAYTMLQSPDKYIDQIYKNRGEIRADRALTTQEAVAKQTIAASQASVDMNRNEFDARRVDARFNKEAALRGEVRDDKRLEATLNPLLTQFNGMERALGITLTPEMKTRLAGLDKKDDIDEKFIQEIALKGVAAGTLKETDVASFVTNTTKQLRSAKAWSRDEPQVKQLLNAAAEKGELKEAVSEIKSKFGVSDDWFKANGFDPKNTDLKSYKSPAYIPIEAAAAKKHGIDQKYLSTIRLDGEKSNSDQVSPKNAKSVYQIMPENAKAYGEANGLDISKPADAAEVAAMLVKERIAIYKKQGLEGNALDAAVYRSYHGGYKGGKDYGPENEKYVQRTMGTGKERTVAAEGRNKVLSQGINSKELMAKAEPFEVAESDAQKQVDEADDALSRFSPQKRTYDREGFLKAQRRKEEAISALEKARQRTKEALGDGTVRRDVIARGVQ